MKTLLALAFVSITCGCQTPIPTSTPIPNPTAVAQPVQTSSPVQGLTPAGAPICTSLQPGNPIVTSIIRKSTSATLTWTKVVNADHYLIFYGTKPGSEEFGVPDTGNVTSFTINALNPRFKYYFEVRAVNGCMPSQPSGQVLGASTSVLAATNSFMLLPRIIIGIIATGVAFCVLKKINL